MADRTWKQKERDAAAYWGGRRNVLSGAVGAQDGSKADVIHDRLFIEVKYRAKCPVWNAWRKSDPNARCLMLGDLAVMHQDDFDEWCETLQSYPRPALATCWGREMDPLWRLYERTALLAAEEGKEPVLMLYRRGDGKALIVTGATVSSDVWTARRAVLQREGVTA